MWLLGIPIQSQQLTLAVQLFGFCSSMGRVVIDMNGFYSHFPHIGPLWKLVEETLSVGLSELRQFTQKFYHAKTAANTICWLIFEVHLILRWLVGAISFTHFTFLCGVSEKALHNYSHLLGKAKIYCGKLPPSLGLLGTTANWSSLAPELSKKVFV